MFALAVSAIVLGIATVILFYFYFSNVGAVIQDGCIVQEGSVIAAGSVLSPGTFVKKDSVFAGNPAKFLRMATAADKDMITQVLL